MKILRKRLIIGLAFLVLAGLVVRPAFAEVYSGHADAWPETYPGTGVDVAIDTSVHTLTFYYHGENYIVTPYPGIGFGGANWYAWDDNGYDRSNTDPAPYHDTVTLSDYYNTYTWAHVKVRWGYLLAMPWVAFLFPEAQANIYVGSGGNGGGGGGCPIVYVYDGTQFIEQGLWDIHEPDGKDVVAYRTLWVAPAEQNNQFKIRLVEHPLTHSYINRVQLLGVDESGETLELRLINAVHSEDGNVLPQLLFSDNKRTDTTANQQIDLTFINSGQTRISTFILVIEGHNMLPK